MKYCKIDKEGQIKLEGDPRLLYAVMLGMRVWIVCSVWRFTAYASIIAGRYAVTRRQFNTTPEGSKHKERKLLDYQAHQQKLIGALAQSITFNLAQNYLGNYYLEFIQQLYAGSENYKPLKIIHHFSAGLKAYYTNSVHSTLTTLRESCGGTGFHAFSGLPYLCNEHSAYVAFEGDNTVMIQQCAKVIIDKV
jgi:acyl-CoA oxidase